MLELDICSSLGANNKSPPQRLQRLIHDGGMKKLKYVALWRHSDGLAQCKEYIILCRHRSCNDLQFKRKRSRWNQIKTPYNSSGT